MENQYRVPLFVAAMRYAKGVSPKGRASRSEFWWGLLFAYVLHLGLSVIMGGTSLYGWLFLALMVLLVFLGWRRMHDIGRPGWWCLVPFYNLYLSMLPSEQADNVFGPVPNVQPIEEKPVAKKVVLGIMALSALIAVVGFFIGGDARDGSQTRFAGGNYYDDSELDSRLFSALLSQAQQEQAQRDRYNQRHSGETSQRRSSWWDEWKQREARERQIRQEEYIRQGARESYQNASPAERVMMKQYGY